MESENYCMDCKKATEIVEDNTSGDTICGECGLVLESWRIEETQEWRNFADDTNDDRDPNRVGQPQGPFLTHSNLVTYISNPNPKPSDVKIFNKKQHDSDAVSKRGLELISNMADSLGLLPTVQHRADEIYVSVEEHKTCRGRKLEAVTAACLFIACRESNVSRTLEELASPFQLKKKEICKAVDLIKKQNKVPMGAVQAAEYVNRFCSSYLGMDKKVVKAIREAVERAEKLDLRRSPKSLLAAIIFMIAQLSHHKKSLRDVSDAVQVAEATIKKSYRDIHPYASTLIPNWFAGQDDISKLSRP